MKYEVTITLEGKNETHPDYPLLPGDIITKEGRGWRKHAPGLSVGGFLLTDEDVDTLNPAPNAQWVIS